MTTRHRCTIRPVHADGTECTHKVRPSGKPLDADCPGRGGYEAACTCGATLERQGIRAVPEEARHTHLREHAKEVC